MLQGIFFFRASLGTSEMRHQDHSPSVIQDLGNGWNGRVDTGCIRNLLLAVEGYIKIDPDKRLLAVKAKVINSLHFFNHLDLTGKIKIFKNGNADIFNFTRF